MRDKTDFQPSTNRFLILSMATVLVFFAFTIFSSSALGNGRRFNPDQPIHNKTISKNKDGTYTLSLDVAGDSIHTEEIHPADIVLVMDVTHSMTWCMDGSKGEPTSDNPMRMEVARDAALHLVDEILGEGSINQDLPENKKSRISLVRFGSHAECNTSGKNKNKPYFTSDADKLKKNITTYIDEDEEIGGTNWSAGFKKANDVMRDARDGVDKIIIFMSDGEPNKGKRTDVGKLTYENAGSKYKYGNFVINYLNDAENTISKFNQMFTVYCGEDEGSGIDLMKGMSAHLEKTDFLEGKNKDSFNNAFDMIADWIYHKYAFTNTTINDTLSKWVDFKVDGSGELEGLKFQKINKKTGQVTEYNEDENFSFNAADKTLSWKPMGTSDLAKKTCYRVSFTVTPTQLAFDEAAKRSREGMDPPDESSDGKLGFYSNMVHENDKTDATVDFQIRQKVVNENGFLVDKTSDMETREYKKPVIEVPVSKLKIKKVWSNPELHKNGFVNYTVTQDGELLVQGTLSAEDGWEDEVSVAAGPSGHSYQVKEVGIGDAYETSVSVDESEFSLGDTADVSYKGIVNSLHHLITFKNKPQLGLKLTKYKDDADKDNLKPEDLLDNAQFTLFNHTHPGDDTYFDEDIDGKDANVVAVETTENGTLSFNELEPGSYWLVETKAPAGYGLCDAFRIDIKVQEGKSFMWLTRYVHTDEGMVAQKQVQISMDGTFGLIKVADRALPDLPDSGSMIGPAAIFLGFALIAAAGIGITGKISI